MTVTNDDKIRNVKHCCMSSTYNLLYYLTHNYVSKDLIESNRNSSIKGGDFSDNFPL